MSAPEHLIYFSPAFSRGSEGVMYSQAQINGAITKALTLLQVGQQYGEAKYPQAYKAYHNLVFKHAEAPIFEFPILGNLIYDGKEKAGPDRVIFGSVSKDYMSANYIGIVASDTELDTPVIFEDSSINKLEPGVTFAEDELAAYADKELLPPPERELLDVSDVRIEFEK